MIKVKERLPRKAARIFALVLCLTVALCACDLALGENTGAEPEQSEDIAAIQDSYRRFMEEDIEDTALVVTMDPYSYIVNQLEPNKIELVSRRYKTVGATVSCAVEINSNGLYAFIKIQPTPEEYQIPLVISQERWDALKSMLGGSTGKKLTKLYQKLGPANIMKQRNAEEILAAYPLLASQDMYFIRDIFQDYPPQRILAEAEQLWAEAGYTSEDFALDKQNVSELTAVPQRENELDFVFESPEKPIKWTRGATLVLANTLTRLADIAINDYVLADNPPDALSGLVFPETYDFLPQYPTVAYQITLDAAREEDGLLILEFDIIPIGEHGWFQLTK